MQVAGLLGMTLCWAGLCSFVLGSLGHLHQCGQCARSIWCCRVSGHLPCPHIARLTAEISPASCLCCQGHHWRSVGVLIHYPLQFLLTWAASICHCNKLALSGGLKQGELIFSAFWRSPPPHTHTSRFRVLLHTGIGSQD